jgi:hypothetical protein
MSSLQALQQQILQAVLAENASPLAAIRDDDIADAESRLSIYRNGYRIRLHDALKPEFVGLQCLAGKSFDTLLNKYVAAHPSGHYNIRWYGSGLAAFLDYAMPWRSKPQLAEMARVDWAISTAFDAADESCKSIADLSEVPADVWAGLQLVLQGNLQIITCHYNADAFRRAADRAAPRPRLRAYAEPRQMLVWRKATTVHYRVLEEDEWQVLGAAIRGESFASLCGHLAQFHGEETAMARMVSLLQGWLESGLIHGWNHAV